MKSFVLQFNWKLIIPSGRSCNSGSTVVGVKAKDEGEAKEKVRLRFFTKNLTFTGISEVAKSSH